MKYYYDHMKHTELEKIAGAGIELNLFAWLKVNTRVIDLLDELHDMTRDLRDGVGDVTPYGVHEHVKLLMEEIEKYEGED